MKLALAAFGLALIGSSCSSTESSFTYDNPYGDDMTAYMQASMAKGMPGPEHKELAEAVGTWSFTSKHYMKPGGDPMTMKGTSVIKTIFNGRFMIEEFKGNFMGSPFEGMLLLGYSNIEEQFISLWIGSMNTEFSFASGTKNENGNLQMSGMMTDVKTPQGRPFRHVSKNIDKNHFTVEMHDTMPDGSEMLMMEINYTRK